jgi:glycosyltransferase involved in cell wall biosynthesis
MVNPFTGSSRSDGQDKSASSLPNVDLNQPSHILSVAEFDPDTLVSIIIPAFNSGPYLSATLTSCREQTHAALEIIVVDDGSTDDTAAIARRIASEEPRLRVICSSNQGQCAARNLGLSQSRGGWVKFLDSDDLLPPGAVARQLALASQFGVGAVSGGSRGFWGQELPQLKLAVVNEYATVDQALVEVFDSLYELQKVHQGTFSEILLRRSLVDMVGGFDVRLRGAEELNMVLRISTGFPNVRAVFERSPSVLIKRLHDNSLAGQLRIQRQDPWVLRSLRYAAEFYLPREKPDSLALKEYVFGRLYHAIALAYRQGFYQEAEEAWVVWRRGRRAVPRLEVWYHDWLHRFLTPRHADRALRLLRCLRDLITGKGKGSE